MLVPATWDRQKQRGPWVYYLMSLCLACEPAAADTCGTARQRTNGRYSPGSSEFRAAHLWVCRDEAAAEAGSGLLFRSVSIQLHLKGALKLEAMAHLSQA